MFTWKNHGYNTTSGKAGSSPPPRKNTTASCEPGVQSRQTAKVCVKPSGQVAAGNAMKSSPQRGCYSCRGSIGKTSGPQPFRQHQYDVWSGPAPILPSRRNSKKNGSVHYEWHWF